MDNEERFLQWLSVTVNTYSAEQEPMTADPTVAPSFTAQTCSEALCPVLCRLSAMP